MMMKGETVIVIYKEANGKDAFGNLIYKDVEESVSNVLVAPGEAADVIDDMRPEGTEVHYTLYFPKSFEGTLETADVLVRGKRLSVVGSPDRFDSANCPTDWNMVVKVGAVNG